MKQVIENTDGTIEVDGVIYEKKQQAEPPKVTLSDVFVKNDSRWMIEYDNTIIKSQLKNIGIEQDRLPTERDAKRVQAFIALINCAKYFNGDVDVIAKQEYCFIIYEHGIFKVLTTHQTANEVRFSTEHGAQETVRILKEARLYEYLFLETK
jgi:hypothetical protein